MNSEIYLSKYETPIGKLIIQADSNSLIGMRFESQISVDEKLNEKFSDNDVIIKVKSRLEKYFLGKNPEIDFEINPTGTDFQKLVWNNLIKIKYGNTKAYSEISQEIFNCMNYSRAVANAIGKNSVILAIPCHRVIRNDGKLGGFSAEIEIKNRLLNFEKDNINI